MWGAQRTNPVYDARYTYLTTREHNKPTPTQAQAAIAAAILRQLHAVITTGRKWDPVIATHGTKHHAAPGRRLISTRRAFKLTVGASPVRH